MQTGNKGITDALVAEIDLALEHHELLKIRLAGAEREDRKQMTAELAERLRAEVVGSIGAVVILYRESEQK